MLKTFWRGLWEITAVFNREVRSVEQKQIASVVAIRLPGTSFCGQQHALVQQHLLCGPYAWHCVFNGVARALA